MSATPPRPARLFIEEVTAGPMFALAVVFLLVLGGLLHRHHLPDLPEGNADASALVDGPVFDPSNLELRIQLGILMALYPLFWLEALVRFFPSWRAAGLGTALRDLILVALIPPWRMSVRSVGTSREIWLPRTGWQPVDRALQRRLEGAFGLPMIFIALLVLPLLAAEFFWSKALREHFWLEFLVESGNALVWFAFTVEFLVMMSVAKNKVFYALVHWIDLAIILLPFVNFMPIFRLLRLGQVLRLEQLSRLGRLYRMQGVALRAWRAFLLLQLIQRILGTSLEKQLERLREMEAAKAEELAELRQEIAALETELERLRSTQTPAPEPMPPETETTGTE